MTRMAGVFTWARILIADGAWFGVATIVALAVGVAGDQFFGQPPLGLRYQTPGQRILTSPAPDGSQEPINLVSLEEVTVLLSRPEVVALDARPRVFYEIGHLPGARSLSREQFDADFALIEPILRAPGKTLLVYCSDAGCDDSALVARALQKSGLGPLLIFPGGFAEWEAAGQPVETEP